jgi:hypothetical protein
MAKKRPQDLLEELGISADDFALVYRKLEEAGDIQEYLSGLSYQWEDLVADAKDAAQDLDIGAKRRRRAGRKPQQVRESFEIQFSDYAKVRAAALSEALANEAASYPAIRRFREEVLGRKLLSSEQARRLVTSPAVRYFWFEWFKEWGIPVVGHAARVVTTGSHVSAFDWKTLSAIMSGFNPYIHSYHTVHVDPPGAQKRVLYAHHEDVKPPEGFNVDKQYYFSTDPEDEFGRPSPQKTLRYFGGDGIREVRMLPGSLLDWLRGLTSLLAGRYGWSQEEAVHFILTGHMPQIQPLKVSTNLLTGYRNNPPVWNINLEVAPWMPAKEVTKAFQEIQQQILQGDSGKEHLSLKKIALFRFVKEQTAGSGEDQDWQELVNRWNQTYDENTGWHYGETKDLRHQRSNFKRDFKKAERVLLHPENHFPRRKVNTELEEWQERDLQTRRKAAEAASNRIEAYLERITHLMDD